MKKQLLLCGILLAAYSVARAQKPDTTQVLVHYKFSHIRDTANRANPYTENMVLLVGRRSAAYKSYDRQLEIEQFKKQVQQQLAGSPDGNIHVNRRSMAPGTVYYQLPGPGKIMRKEVLFINKYLVTDALPVIDWKISGDTATLGSLHCQKATAHFKGRDYTAWFCPDLPLHVGPWKLNGLPGVIVEAYDVKKEVVFKFDGIEKVFIAPATDGQSPEQATIIRGLMGTDDEDTDPSIIRLPANAVKITGKEFAELESAMRKDPGAFAAMAAKAGTAPGYNGPQPRLSIHPEPLFNNPIELPENK